MTEEPASFYSENPEEQFEAMREENVSDRFLEFRDDFAGSLGSGKVLYAGCGPGRHTAYLREKELEVVGVDIAPGSVEYAEKRYGGDFRTGDIRDLEFDNGTFDGVFCSAAIMFLPPEDMELALSEFHRILKDGGILYITFKIGEGMNVTEKWGSAVERYYVPMEEAEDKLESAGFEILREAAPKRKDHNDFSDFLCRK